MIGLDQLGLAVALDAGDAEHLAPGGCRRRCRLSRCRPALVDHVDPARARSSDVSVTVDSSVSGEGSSRADHQLGELALGGGLAGRPPPPWCRGA